MCIMLEGPEGCGKAHIAKLAAQEANVPFVHVSLEKVVKDHPTDSTAYLDTIISVS